VSKDWLERLSEHTRTPTSQLKFIMDAWNQVSMCFHTAGEGRGKTKVGTHHHVGPHSVGVSQGWGGGGRWCSAGQGCHKRVSKPRVQACSLAGLPVLCSKACHSRSRAGAGTHRVMSM
jgi:hypothetical protein